MILVIIVFIHTLFPEPVEPAIITCGIFAMSASCMFPASDGQPADSGYYGIAAEEDLRGIKTEYRRKGICFVAAAIGDDKDSIERIYGDAYMDISDLHTLPITLTNVVKRFIRT